MRQCVRSHHPTDSGPLRRDPPENQPVRLLLVGAAGRTGLETLEHACSRGHKVTALVREPGRLHVRAGMTVVAGSPLDSDFLRPLVLQNEVVISVLGLSRSGDPHLLGRAARAMVKALPTIGGARYLVLSQGLLFPTRNPIVHLLRWGMAERVADMREMEDVLEKSSVNFTIVRPPRLTVAGGRRGYRCLRDARPPGSSMSRSTLARFLIDEAEAGANRRAIVGVS